MPTTTDGHAQEPTSEPVRNKLIGTAMKLMFATAAEPRQRRELVELARRELDVLAILLKDG